MPAFANRSANPFSRAASAFGFGFRLLFAFLTIMIGALIVFWVLYNFFIERLPEYSGSTTFPFLGAGPMMVTTGILWLRRLCRPSLAQPRGLAQFPHSPSRPGCPVNCRWCGAHMIPDPGDPHCLCKRCGNPNTGYHTAH